MDTVAGRLAGIARNQLMLGGGRVGASRSRPSRSTRWNRDVTGAPDGGTETVTRAVRVGRSARTDCEYAGRGARRFPRCQVARAEETHSFDARSVGAWACAASDCWTSDGAKQPTLAIRLGGATRAPFAALERTSPARTAKAREMHNSQRRRTLSIIARSNRRSVIEFQAADALRMASRMR